MAEPKKVINGLECCRVPFTKCYVGGCPYAEYQSGCKVHLKDDALTLLKEQQSAYERGKHDGISQYLREREEDEEYEY